MLKYCYLLFTLRVNEIVLLSGLFFLVVAFNFHIFVIMKFMEQFVVCVKRRGESYTASHSSDHGLVKLVNEFAMDDGSVYVYEFIIMKLRRIYSSNYLKAHLLTSYV